MVGSTEGFSELRELERAVAEGGRQALGSYLERHRDRLRSMVVLRLDRRVRGRIDASDVIQEAFLEATERIGDYLESPEMPFFLWLRFITSQKLLQIHRQHLGARMRDANREISLYRGAYPEATSAALAAQLVGKRTSPSQAAMRAEMKIHLQEALNAMEPTDREVLALRHFERLSNVEAAQVLRIKESAASKRYLRALKRLREVIEDKGLHGLDPER